MRGHYSTTLPVAVAILAATALPAQAQGYQHLGKHGAQVVTPCNPGDSQDVQTCRVDTLPGVDGFTQIDNRQADVVRNSVTIGSTNELVWQSQADPALYIFGVQLTLDDVGSDSTGRVFRTNDLFRRTQRRYSVAVAYDQDIAPHALLDSGRTAQGLNEYDEGTQPDREDSWVDFRIVVDPTAVGASMASPWLLARVRAPKGYIVDPLGLRLLDSDFEHPKRDEADIYVSSFEPVGVPPAKGGD